MTGGIVWVAGVGVLAESSRPETDGADSGSLSLIGFSITFPITFLCMLLSAFLSTALFPYRTAAFHSRRNAVTETLSPKHRSRRTVAVLSRAPARFAVCETAPGCARTSEE